MIIGIKVVSLQKISCTRQFVSKLTLRSFALSLQKISYTRQFVSKLTLRSFALSLQRKTYKLKTIIIISNIQITK